MNDPPENRRLYIVRAMDENMKILDFATCGNLLDAKGLADVMAMDPKPGCYCVEVEDYRQRKIVHALAILKEEMFAVVNP